MGAELLLGAVVGGVTLGMYWSNEQYVKPITQFETSLIEKVNLFIDSEVKSQEKVSHRNAKKFTRNLSQILQPYDALADVNYLFRIMLFFALFAIFSMGIAISWADYSLVLYALTFLMCLLFVNAILQLYDYSRFIADFAKSETLVDWLELRKNKNYPMISV